MQKISLATMVLALASAAQTEASPDQAQKYVQITEGFLMGALKAEGLTDIEHCIQDGEHILQDAEKAYQDFQKKSIDGIIDGVKDVADAIKYIQSAMKDCSAAKQDWAKLEQIALTFENPVSFSWHIAGDIIHNGVKITREVETGVQDYKSGNWYDFGVQFGEAAAQVFLGSESQEAIAKQKQNQKMAEFYKGFSKAFGLQFSIFHLLVCVQYEDQAAEGLWLAAQAFNKAYHDQDVENMIGDFIGGCMGLKLAYQQFENGLPWCESSFNTQQDVTPLMNSLKFMEHPVEHIPTMTSNLMEYQAEIKDDMLSALFFLKTEQYEKFGEFLGNAVKILSEKQTAKAAENNLFLY